MNKQILLLEDDFNLGDTIKDLLVAGGYQVDYVTSGQTAIDLTYDHQYDLYIFDINIPDIDGLDILKSLRDADDLTPAIFISAMTDLKTVLKAFDAGAYDFIKKPFYSEELLIKVNLKLMEKDQKIQYKDLEYFPKEKKLLRNQKLVSLGEVSTQIFDLFIHNIGRVINKTELYECMNNPGPNALRFHISNINKITGIEIKNIRGRGYILEQS
ncbi:response regulator transcription factor [Sulfurovum sp. NBC37-1]|uniref:response regulator transcription factor n=1 Tax=Sulfurovum sp. (strain NBC37-1) TaxID=387093 RepID=UPI000158790C|nr:response regulator transcription factor [Sulfurovum sp. NBC37-1]BAF71739.1 two-component response regulator [Sulfurovum sp. NBC37-1]